MLFLRRRFLQLGDARNGGGVDRIDEDDRIDGSDSGVVDA